MRGIPTIDDANTEGRILRRASAPLNDNGENDTEEPFPPCHSERSEESPSYRSIVGVGDSSAAPQNDKYEPTCHSEERSDEESPTYRSPSAFCAVCRKRHTLHQLRGNGYAAVLGSPFGRAGEQCEPERVRGRFVNRPYDPSSVICSANATFPQGGRLWSCGSARICP